MNQKIADLRLLRGLYDRLPPFPCKPTCTECCKYPVPMTRLEANLIVPLTQADSRFEPWDGLGCMFRGTKGCQIYEVRPLVCRLFGWNYGAATPTVTVGRSVVAAGSCDRRRVPAERAKAEEVLAMYGDLLRRYGLVTLLPESDLRTLLPGEREVMGAVSFGEYLGNFIGLQTRKP